MTAHPDAVPGQPTFRPRLKVFAVQSSRGLRPGRPHSHLGRVASGSPLSSSAAATDGPEGGAVATAFERVPTVSRIAVI